ncbi:MAG TPA: efflux RND transporter periplasmic adaptor subunit [Rudaea sp.]|nr:efflux RND transporter periplasmic adaptor subunit [Rudaea sp.]
MHPFQEPQRPSPRRLRIVGIAALTVALTLAIGGVALRVHAGSSLKAKTEADAVPTVNVIDPAPGESHEELVLPGDVQAYFDAPIYARVPGYLKKWYFDIGARVKAGDLLAEIETPELDQQLHQAQADLATAVAKEKLAQITAKRWNDMLASDSVSKQEADEKSGDYEAKMATTTAARANVERLQALSSFKRIVAPFDGVVTARKTDIGDLINAGSSGAELFRVADTHKLRVYVQVPQTYSDEVTVGMTAQLHFPEKPERSYPATVVGTSQAINEASRSLLVQLEADNADGKLTSGSYADVHFDLPATPGVLQLPVTALLFRQHGMKVATLGQDGKVTLKNIQIGRDMGTRVEVVAGLDPTDRVIDSPPDWIAQGDHVRIAASAPAAAPKIEPTKVADAGPATP